MPDVGLINAVEHQVGQGDWIDRVILFAPEEGASLYSLKLVGGGNVGVVRPSHMFEGLSEEPTCSASGVIDGLAVFRGDDLHHCPDDFAWCEELSAVVPFLSHLPKNPFVDL